MIVKYYALFLLGVLSLDPPKEITAKSFRDHMACWAREKDDVTRREIQNIVMNSDTKHETHYDEYKGRIERAFEFNRMYQDEIVGTSKYESNLLISEELPEKFHKERKNHIKQMELAEKKEELQSSLNLGWGGNQMLPKGQRVWFRRWMTVHHDQGKQNTLGCIREYVSRNPSVLK